MDINSISNSCYTGLLHTVKSSKTANSDHQLDSMKNVDIKRLRIEKINFTYDSKSDAYVSYTKSGTKIIWGSAVDNSQGDYQDVIGSHIDSNYSKLKYQPKKVDIPEGGESIEDEIKQQKVVDIENAAQKAEVDARIHQYDDVKTPIADNIHTYLSGLISGNIALGMKLGDIDPDVLSQTVIAYDKAKTEIEDKYSTENITKRAQSEQVSDVQAYSKEQLKIKDAEMFKLNQYYEKDTAINVDKYTAALQNTMDSKNSYNSHSMKSDLEGKSVAELANQLSDIYSKYKSENNVDYSKEDIKDIAKKFNTYSINKTEAKVNVSGTEFTYQDIYNANKVLRSISVNTGGSVAIEDDAFTAALGKSEVSYVAQHYMSPEAGKMLVQAYGDWADNDISKLDLHTTNDKFIKAFKKGIDVLENIDTTDADTFKKGYSSAIANTDIAKTCYYNPRTYKEIQNAYDLFARDFLNND